MGAHPLKFAYHESETYDELVEKSRDDEGSILLQSSSFLSKRFAAITLGLALITPVLSHAGPTVPFELFDGHWIVVPVVINGSGPFDLVLDTGSDLTLLDPLLVSRLGGKIVQDYRLVTATGSRTVTCYRLEDVRLGPRRVDSLEVLAHESPGWKGLGVSGILGQNFLRRFNFVLDYKSKTITFEENSEFEKSLQGEIYSLLESSNRRLVLVPPQSRESRPSLFTLDSAADGMVLFGTRFDGLGLCLTPGGRLEQLRTVTGHAFVSYGTIRSFRIGNKTFQNLRVCLASDKIHDRYRLENGVLPTNCFQSIYVNNIQKFVAFNPRFINN